MKIYISGLHSGTNPQPGVGVTRSLRLAYPQAELVGVEYSNRCSGIHWPQLDDVILQRPWEELNLTAHGKWIAEILDAGGLWLSGTDLESVWLASVLPNGHPNLLAPSGAALRRTAKPSIDAHKGLPLRIPAFISTQHADWDLHAFCRAHDWQVWLKGPYYDAIRAGTWDAFEAIRASLSQAWSTHRLFLQAHVAGYEESIVLAAYKGELLECAQMRKRELTEVGKTWAGDISDAPEELIGPLHAIIRELNWTGGAELEMVRDPDGQCWLLEWNPRFPAWIHGATIAGRNLPAALVEGATGIPAEKTPAECEQFTRVVVELPVRCGMPLPPLPEPYAGEVGHSLKHPSGLTMLAERLHKLNRDELNADRSASAATHNNTSGNGATEAVVPRSYLEDLSNFDFTRLETPSWVFLEGTARKLFRRAAELARDLTNPDLELINAYSIKTNPDPRMIKFALESGFLAEAISLLEVNRALAVGFDTTRVVLNGPGKWWPHRLLPQTPLHAVFCDSLADLNRVATALAAGDLQARIVGLRLRTTHIESRFGIPVDTPDGFEALLESIPLLPRDVAFGVHFHMASSAIGVKRWWHLFESMLRWCRSIETLARRKIDVLDIGGGWFPDDWQAGNHDHLARAIVRVRALLPNVGQIISEPGKAVAQPSMALATRILEIQPTVNGQSEAVIDGSIAELPMHFFYPHRILGRDNQSGQWQLLKRGKTRLMGRLCMEHDQVAANIELTQGARPGDLLLFCDAGGYDRSMSYVFGRG